MADEMTEKTASCNVQFSFDAFDDEFSPGQPHLSSETRRVSDASNCTDFQWHLSGTWESLLIPAELIVQRGGESALPTIVEDGTDASQQGYSRQRRTVPLESLLDAHGQSAGG
jgi:hypothetical protein